MLTDNPKKRCDTIYNQKKKQAIENAEKIISKERCMVTFMAYYAIGDKVETSGGVWFVVIGYEYIPERALRYICIPRESKDNYERKYFYPFEINKLI